MKNQTTKENHVQKKKAEFAENQASIQKITGISENEYYAIEFECGCLFLEEFFPPNTKLHPLYFKYAYCPNYWVWWRSEWKLWEGRFLMAINMAPIKAPESFWLEGLLNIINDADIDQSFHQNYIPLIQKKSKKLKSRKHAN